MNTKNNVKAGGFNLNHNQKLTGGLRVKTSVKAGSLSCNHNETAAGGRRVRAAVERAAHLIAGLGPKMQRSLVLVAVLVCLGTLTTAFGQLDYDTYFIFENGAPVGIIYVPDHTADPSLYAENWILYPNYIYPSAKNLVTMQIVPSTTVHYTSEEDFYKRAPWGAGFRFVYGTAHDTTTLPGR